MILDDYSYENIFKNPFSPNIEVFKFNWEFLSKSDKKEEINTEFAEISQKDDLKTENKDISIVEPADSVSYELKDITPKKGLFRRR